MSPAGGCHRAVDERLHLGVGVDHQRRREALGARTDPGGRVLRSERARRGAAAPDPRRPRISSAHELALGRDGPAGPNLCWFGHELGTRLRHSVPRYRGAAVSSSMGTEGSAPAEATWRGPPPSRAAPPARWRVPRRRCSRSACGGGGRRHTSRLARALAVHLAHAVQQVAELLAIEQPVAEKVLADARLERALAR